MDNAVIWVVQPLLVQLLALFRQYLIKQVVVEQLSR
jgi:hypothetical protein